MRLSGGWSKNQIATNDQQGILTWDKSHTREVENMWVLFQDGLTAEKVAQGNSETLYWVFDHHAPALRMDSLDTAKTRLFRKIGDNWV